MGKNETVMPPVMHLLGDGQRVVHFPFGLTRYACYIICYVNKQLAHILI